MLHPALAPIVALLCATSAWGSLFLVGKPLLSVLDPLWFTVVRYLLAGLLLSALAQLFGLAPWRKLRARLGRLTLLGLAGYGFFSVLVFYGLARSLPSHGAVIMASMPFTTLLLRWALDGQRPSPASLVGAAMALAGVATVANVFSPAQAADTPMLLGDLLSLAGTLGWVLYTRGAAAMPELSPLEYTALTAVAAWPWMLLAALGATLLGLVPAPAVGVLVSQLSPLLYIAVVPTVLAAMAFNFGVRRLGAVAGTLFINMVPVSVLGVHALLGQAPTGAELGGAGLVALALGVNAWAGRKLTAGVGGHTRALQNGRGSVPVRVN